MSAPPSTRETPGASIDNVISFVEAHQRQLLHLRLTNGPFVDVTPSLKAALLNHGKLYTPIARPKYFRRQWKFQECFHNAAEISFKTDARYVEGIAWDDKLGVGFHHAWNTLDGRCAFDQTWPTPGGMYFGIEVQPPQLLNALWRTGTYGHIIENIERAAP